ncbi:hypothetical protein JMJ77_0009017 [Colletotrichum scovillei]|uniref:Uncharacterized protein n=1 Tax=Colletotrichum scovillei TaxID=1209932 RepID=A0A9P7QQI6_9PEZI|nr:hypothetical protein JMJ78_0010736 [Colletotrichum scovillei]KAG7040742.1 hypothetical protein JMJ77_0009017 [Colletotrichum scovillei]KAG7060786.1 hypothetical protein JMJ76_0004000 [Colletotrichum scovillei]
MLERKLDSVTPSIESITKGTYSASKLDDLRNGRTFCTSAVFVVAANEATQFRTYIGTSLYIGIREQTAKTGGGGQAKALQFTPESEAAWSSLYRTNETGSNNGGAPNENLNKPSKPSAKPNGIIGQDGTVQRTKLVAPNPLWGRAGGGLETSLKTGESERDSSFQETIPHLPLPPPRLPPGPKMCRANTPALFAQTYGA